MRSFTPRKSYSKESSGGCCNFHHTFRVVFKFEMKGFSFLVHISSGGSRNQLMGGLFRLLFFFLHKNGGGLKEGSTHRWIHPWLNLFTHIWVLNCAWVYFSYSDFINLNLYKNNAYLLSLLWTNGRQIRSCGVLQRAVFIERETGQIFILIYKIYIVGHHYIFLSTYKLSTSAMHYHMHLKPTTHVNMSCKSTSINL